MSLKMTFLGSGSAFTIGDGNYQSNVMLEKNNDTLLLDAGSDLRFSLAAQNRTYHDINNVYISHLHGDHVGGLEWLALATYFDPVFKKKLNLFISDQLVGDLWNKSLAGGLRTLANELSMLDTYFNVHIIDGEGVFKWQGIEFKLVQTVHVYSDFKLVPCFGLLFKCGSTRVFYTADTQYAPSQLLEFYQEADIIFHDCETLPIKTGVHAHYTELLNAPLEFRKKMWLYHYNPGALPDAKADGFLGFVTRGQTFEF